ncbi:hypothetical protein ACA910_017070 [Epithemia clementina (nom. ined.)]
MATAAVMAPTDVSSSSPGGAAAPPTAAPPLFECFVNVPHPAASKSCPPISVIPAPHAQPDSRIVSQIQSFCFPEYDEAVMRTPQTNTPGQTTAIFNSMVLNRYDQYAMQPKSFLSFTFTLQLQDGRRMYGHVRRSLPLHENAPTRYDVGRRGERALVLLTKTAGAGQLYQAILKSIDAIASLNKALRPELRDNGEPEKLFLHSLYNEQQRMAVQYQQRPAEERGKPLIANISGLELQRSRLYAAQDINRFMIPTCLLYRPHTATGPTTDDSVLPTADSTSSVLPLLRCIGVAHALRILSALLSERRIILTSSSPTRLSTCSHAALAMVRCGLLHWQHLYIPVLPPHLWQYLGAPYPYLIGILSSAVRKLDQTDGLGEVLIVNLDTNSMETRNIPQQVVAQRLPDLFSSADPPYYNESGGGSTPKRNDRDAPPSASEFLAQDLLEILKTDKKALIGETSAFTNVGETAGKAAKAIKSGFSKLKRRIKGGGSSSSSNVETEETDDTAGGDQRGDDAAGVGNETSSVADDYIFTEGCHNEVGEQEVRLAFTVFFLAMIGNMRWYLNVPAQGQLPQLDVNRFLEYKRKAGDGQGTAIWPLLQNFCQTQMFSEFAKARVEEVRLRVVVSTPDAPLFSQCAQYLRQHSIDFSITSVRSVARQVAQANPGRLTGLLQTNARRMAMTLTSNKAFEGDSGRAIAQLVEQCRESSSVLFDVMSVIWLRLRDSKGMHWKHGLLAMQILKNLLYHGPLAAVAEATDGLDKIRALKYYEHMRGGVAQDMRANAAVLFNLLVDRSRLWTVRRLCAKKRRDLSIPPSKKPKLEKMLNIKPTDEIEQIHGAFHPMARATIVQLPPQPSTIPPALVANQSRGQPSRQQLPTSNSEDLFGFGAVEPSATSPAAVNADLMGLFGNMDVSSAAPDAPATTAEKLNRAQPPPPAPQRRLSSTDSSSIGGDSATASQMSNVATVGSPSPAVPALVSSQPYYGGPSAGAPSSQQAVPSASSHQPAQPHQQPYNAGSAQGWAQTAPPQQAQAPSQKYASGPVQYQAQPQSTPAQYQAQPSSAPQQYHQAQPPCGPVQYPGQLQPAPTQFQAPAQPAPAQYQAQPRPPTAPYQSAAPSQYQAQPQGSPPSQYQGQPRGSPPSQYQGQPQGSPPSQLYQAQGQYAGQQQYQPQLAQGGYQQPQPAQGYYAQQQPPQMPPGQPQQAPYSQPNLFVTGASQPQAPNQQRPKPSQFDPFAG